MAQLSAWQDYKSHKLYIQQILIPLTVRDNVCVLPGKTGLVLLTLQPNKTSFTPKHTITSKGVAYIKPLDLRLPLRLIEIEFKNNRCCIEIHNTSDTTVEFLHGQEMAYLDTRPKGLCTIPVPVIVLCLSAIFVCNINSSKLHFQSVALRSQYSDHMPEAVTLH